MAGAPCAGSKVGPSKYLPTMRGAFAAPIEDRADLILEQRALLLDHDDEIESAGEIAHGDRVERPDHADFEQAQAERRAVVVEAEIAERLQEILPRLAGRDDADARVRAVADHAVEFIRAGVGERRRELVVVEPLLLHERHVDRTGADSARRFARPLGNDDRGRVRADIDRAAALGDVGDDFHPDPAAGKARHRDAVQAEVDQLLGVRRIEDGHADRDERGVGKIDRRRRFRAVVVARERKRSALRRRSGEVGVPQRVARAVDAGALAVPDAEHAIDRRAGKARHVLRAPDGGRGEVLVEPRAEDDVVPGEDRACAPQFDVVSAHRGTAITGNIAAGVEAGRRVAKALLDRQAHERLHPGHVEPALGNGPAVLEGRLRAGERNSHASVLRASRFL